MVLPGPLKLLPLLLARGLAMGSETGRGGLAHLTVKILAQRRVGELSRLLASLEAAAYPEGAVVDLEIHVDRVSAGSARRASGARSAEERGDVVRLGASWASRWPRGAASVVEAPERRGVRGAWLAASDPGLHGEELGRVVIFEDDVVARTAARIPNGRASAHGGHAGRAGRVGPGLVRFAAGGRLSGAAPGPRAGRPERESRVAGADRNRRAPP